MFRAPNEFRVRKHKLLGSEDIDGNNGFFVIPHHRIKDHGYGVQMSDGEGWEHASITIQCTFKRMVERCPTWEEMCYIKNLLWDQEDVVIQYHPPASEYVNNHPYCLHLWRPINMELPRPHPSLVGIIF